MITVNATMSQLIKIGHQGENKAVQVAFDLTPFQAAFQGGYPQLVVRRPCDQSGYPVALIVDGSKAIWIVSASDTEKAGHGQCELQWFVGDTLAKSDKYNVLIYSSIPGDAVPPDAPSKAWFEKILSDIGDLSYLDTEAKENLVAAINEARQTGGGGAGGTSDHQKLSNRDAAEQHPITAITGLEAALAGKQPAGSYLTDKDLDSTITIEGKAADAKAVGDALRSLSEEMLTEETDPTVPAWAKAAQKPSYTASEVGADPSGTAASQVAAHNTGADTHSDIRLLIQGLTDRLNALADSDDTTLDQLSEVVAYIKSNRSLIEAITTSKVSVADIIDNLTTNVANKPLSAAQGFAIKALIDGITIPDKLPNPNALTFTGAVTGSYDGSAPLSVEIPSGGGGSSGGSGKAKSQILIDQEITELTSSLSVTLEHDFHNLTAIISCGSDGAALTAGSDGTAVASKIGLLIDTTSFGHNSRKVSQIDTNTTTWQNRMIGAEWSDDLAVFKRGFAVNVATAVGNSPYNFNFGGTSTMHGTLGTDDNAPRTGKTANIVVYGAYLNVGTRVVLWGEYYE